MLKTAVEIIPTETKSEKTPKILVELPWPVEKN